jgi:hypothetical protein
LPLISSQGRTHCDCGSVRRKPNPIVEQLRGLFSLSQTERTSPEDSVGAGDRQPDVVELTQGIDRKQCAGLRRVPQSPAAFFKGACLGNLQPACSLSADFVQQNTGGYGSIE